MKSDAFYSGITEETARNIKFKKYIGKSGRTWLVGISNDELHVEILNKIYVSAHKGDAGGFDGSTLQFQLEDGSIISLKGPWHSNPTAFTEDTGIELLP